MEPLRIDRAIPMLERHAIALQGMHRTLDIALPDTYTEHFRYYNLIRAGEFNKHQEIVQ